MPVGALFDLVWLDCTLVMNVRFPQLLGSLQDILGDPCSSEAQVPHVRLATVLKDALLVLLCHSSCNLAFVMGFIILHIGTFL
jgi:hypothetical protein